MIIHIDNFLRRMKGFDRTNGNLFASKRNTKVSLGVFSSRRVTPMISSKDVAQGKAMAEKLLAE